MQYNNQIFLAYLPIPCQRKYLCRIYVENLCRIKATDMESVYFISKKSVKSTIVQKITSQTQLYCVYIQCGIDHETIF